MSYENNELQYTTCDVCGHEKKCFSQYESGEEVAVCQDCLRITDRN
ncbi:hypothetical protein [Pelosinus propionicus]|uniref:ClpX C4-type zinc finger n=1 Tax=Pelosinus propionicus DSM 13327 TaxID=1123291 RepID=A0A1I4QKL4_9FIRM|nr:hypothetical protein [Pelosinus propionicus]SFM40306.1 hypothetical protein SAMN04490355_11073 [Pelosinus propionicus DSM 13327]